MLSRLLWHICLWLLAVPVVGQVRVLRTPDNTQYLEHLPAGYTTAGTERYPLIVYLHGNEGKGNGSVEQVMRITQAGPMQYIVAGGLMEFQVNGRTERPVTLAPQMTPGTNSWTNTQVHSFIEFAKTHYHIDPARVYLTGFSMGGAGLWQYASQHAANVAALAPVGAVRAYSATISDAVRAAGTPIWIFHGENDELSPASEVPRWVARINTGRPAGSPLANGTVLPSATHDVSQSLVYTLPVGYSPNLYEWMLGQKRGQALANFPPDVQLTAPAAGSVIEVQAGVGISLQANATDPELQLARVDFYAGQTLLGSATAAPFTWQWTLPLAGPQSLRAKAVDRSGGEAWSATVNVTLNVSDCGPLCPNRLPVLLPQGTVSIREGQLAELTLSASDPDDALVLTSPKIVVLGSSTAQGTGAPAGSGWVARMTTWLSGVAKGTPQVINLGTGGYTTAHILPTGTLTSSGRISPDPARNITAALAYQPDIIIVNMPTNDVSQGFPTSETMANYRTIYAAARQAGVRIFLTTTQPRTNFILSMRQRLQTQGAQIMQEFGPYAISVYNDLATPELTTRPEYDADGTHLNAAGHEVIFNKVAAAIGYLVAPQQVGLQLVQAPGFILSGPQQQSGTATTRRFQLRPSLADAGTYTVVAEATDRNGGRQTLQFQVEVADLPMTNCLAGQGITLDRWNTLASTNGRIPDVTANRTSFEVSATQSPSQVRFSGYICPPVSGDYVFWMSASQSATLSLSTDHRPANAVNILTAQADQPGHWRVSSAPVRLQAGVHYYIQATSSAASMADHVAVGWQLPDGTYERPLQAVHLAPFVGLEANSTDLTPPSAPTGLAATEVNSTEVRLSWQPAPEPDVQGYRVYRSTSSNFTLQTAEFTSPVLLGTAFTNSGLLPGTTYYYLVTTIDQSGNQSAPSTILTITTPFTPTLLRTFKINVHTGATGTLPDWNVLRATGITGGSRVLSNLRTDAGTTSALSITAFHQSEGSDIPGASANTGFTGGLYPNEVIQSTAWTTTTGRLRLAGLDRTMRYTLTLYGSRNQTGNRLTNYTVNGETKTLDCSNNRTNTVLFANLTPDANGEIWFSFSRGAGAAYAYLNAVIVEEFSAGAPSAPQPPSAPTGVVAQATGSSTVSMSWSAVSGATSYQVYRSTTSGFAIGAGTRVGTGLSGTGYSDTGLLASTTYYYRVTAVNGVGESVGSGQVSVQTQALPQPPSAPTGVVVQATGSSTVSLSWSAVSGATSYQVYRSTTSGFAIGAGTRVGTGLSGTGYSDTGLLASTTYYYRVTAVNGVGESVGSGQVSVQTQAASLAPVLLRTFKINVHTGATGTLPDWNVLRATSIAGGSRVLSNLRTDAGATSALSITAFHQSEGSDIPAASTNTGFTGGLYPNEVIQSTAWTTTTGRLRLAGLDRTRRYTLTLYGARNQTGNRLTNYTVNGGTKTLDCSNNRTNMVSFDNLTPDANGEIWFSFSRGAGAAYAYLNAVVLEEFSAAGVRMAQVSSISENRQPESLSKAKWELFPNPFADVLQIAFPADVQGRLMVEMTDMSGRSVHSYEGETTGGVLTIGLPAYLPKGMYLLHLRINGKIFGIRRVVRE